jgi:hypothetical protein
MKNSTQQIFLGIFLIGIGLVTLFYNAFTLVWIGGFIAGISLIASGYTEQVKDAVPKEMITCHHCGQKLNAPIDRKNYNIRCPKCKQSPFKIYNF